MPRLLHTRWFWWAAMGLGVFVLVASGGFSHRAMSKASLYGKDSSARVFMRHAAACFWPNNSAAAENIADTVETGSTTPKAGYHVAKLEVATVRMDDNLDCDGTPVPKPITSSTASDLARSSFVASSYILGDPMAKSETDNREYVLSALKGGTMFDRQVILATYEPNSDYPK